MHFKYSFISFSINKKMYLKCSYVGGFFTLYTTTKHIFNYLIIQTCNYYYTHFIILLVEENYIYTRSKLNDKHFRKEVPFVYVVVHILYQNNLTQESIIIMTIRGTCNLYKIILYFIKVYTTSHVLRSHVDSCCNEMEYK